jgi:hypothetical protein
MHNTFDPVTRLRLQRGAEHLHRLGPRAVSEFLAEIADKVGGWPMILGLLMQYEVRLTPQMLRVAGGDRLPTLPLRVVPR